MSFKDIFHIDYSVINSAHARVNLIGEHTDYTGGYVLPSLLNFKTTIQISKNQNKQYQVYSEHFTEQKNFTDFLKSTNNEWIDYVKGCLFVFYDENKHIPNTHLNMFISSTIPMGRGISSSSALCVAILKTLNDFFNTQYSEKHIAILAQKVERDYIGVSGGIMDQMVSSIGIHRKAFFLDCLSLKFELIDIPEEWGFYLVDSAVQRNLRDSAYNERYNQLKKAEEFLGVEYLGSIKPKQFDENKINDKLILKRAKHVVSENERVIQAKQSILKKDIKIFGKLMNESHQSYARDFDASTRDVDLIVDRSIASGAEGARLTGGGFGGFTVSLINKNFIQEWKKNMLKFYDSKNIFEV
ncbi:MAG: galactokinase [Pelagibacteraceae bacterium]|jgi:galactokinase|nr:galactokinase [Pelagibacteraceae bacterium]MBT3901727.1 galactokinase [Pelagibacteraceae bacterium]MBT4646318.1 galactokinase [Pelagibacteraceae bacterium]MBT4951774.1 galactokinase [Pelagibacteraceae bacterium]MBT5214802.1 galactokinase [Pelagibacteraceae bacterium]